MVRGQVTGYIGTTPVYKRKRKSTFKTPIRKRRKTYTKSKVNQSELKGCEYDLDVDPVISTVTTNVFTCVTLVSPGSGSFNRIGKKVFPKYLYINGEAQYNYRLQGTTSNLIDGILRMVVVWDKQPSGVQPTFDTIFGRTIIDGTESTEVFDPRKYDNMNRFTILKDVYIDTGIYTIPPTGGSENEVQKSFKITEYIKFPKDSQIVYSGVSVPCTIADVSSGACYVIFRSETAATEGNWNIVGCTARFRYTDG